MGQVALAAWKGRGAPASLAERDYEAAADRIGCDIAAIKAVWEVEASGRHFLNDGSVVRRFEPHHFPSAYWAAIGFAVNNGELPWRASLRLSSEAMFRKAVDIDVDAAMRASSWGAPQIMGFNHADAGFDSPRDMVEHMAISAAHQLGAFVQLVEAWGIATAIRAHDWRSFAARYNGSGQVDRYARLMETAYRKHSGGARSPEVLRVGSRGVAVKELQRALGIEIDGAFGPATHAAVMAFQERAGLRADGAVGHLTWSALSAKPPAQADATDAQAALGEKIAGATAAVGAVSTAAAQARDVVPDAVWTFASYGAVALALAAGAIFLIRKARS